MMNRVTKVYGTLPGKAATIAVNFVKDRFRQQNWVGARTEPWKKTKQRGRKKSKRAILVKSARLKRDPHKIFVREDAALIGTSTLTKDYARIHNEGGTVNTTATIGEHERKPHTRVRKGRREKVGRSTVKEHTRKVKFKMPRRQYMGASPVMDKQIERMIAAELIRAVKK
jgi:phage gpG-like protein